MSFLPKFITTRMTLAFAALGLAPAPATLAAAAPSCDAKHEICLGDTIVAPFVEDGKLFTGRYLPDHSHFAQGKLLYPGSAKLLAPPPKQTGSDTSEYANH